MEIALEVKGNRETGMLDNRIKMSREPKERWE